jgi:sulfoxide reductase heme-binding subunit YedZ
VGYVLLSAAVVLGLVMATRAAPGRFRPALRVTHERAALLALGAVAAHGLLLLPDSWLHPSLLQIVVPFTMGYRPLWTGLGICAAYLAAGLSLSYYARARIGGRRWRNAHRLIPVAWALAAVHVLGAGTDAGALAMQAVLAATVLACAGLLAYRWLGLPKMGGATHGSAAPLGTD